MKDQKDIPVQLFVRITRKENEFSERALLIAKDEKGREFAFMYHDLGTGELEDLTVCDNE